MNLSVALRLGRVSNLPTVTSNVLAAVALAGGAPARLSIALTCIAMSLMYTAGMFLNDAFDREIDARERPERPIPSGQVGAALVFDVGFGLLLAGIAITTIVAFATGAGWKPVLCVIALGSLIVFYDAYHKENPLSPVVMGLCRAGVYATAAFVSTSDVQSAVVYGVIALIAYLIGLTYIARQENLTKLGNLWPLAFMLVPFWIAFPHNWFAGAIYCALIIAVRRALGLLFARKIKDAVTLLIAGICLLDACFAANQGCTGLAIVSLVAFGLTTLFQRIIPGT